jgi:hypothetical protein
VVVACGGSAAPAPQDAPSGFEFVGEYALDPTIDAATFGSASYVGGQKIELDITYPSFEVATEQASYQLLQLVSDRKTAAMTIGPSCTTTCGIMPIGVPYREVDQYTVIWNPPDAEPNPQGSFSCQTPTSDCGGTN